MINEAHGSSEIPAATPKRRSYLARPRIRSLMAVVALAAIAFYFIDRPRRERLEWNQERLELISQAKERIRRDYPTADWQGRDIYITLSEGGQSHIVDFISADRKSTYRVTIPMGSTWSPWFNRPRSTTLQVFGTAPPSLPARSGTLPIGTP